MLNESSSHHSGADGYDSLYEQIAVDLTRDGYSVLSAAMPAEIVSPLAEQARARAADFAAAKIGRGADVAQNDTVRRDKIAWIDGDTPAEQAWIDWTEGLRRYLNRRLMLGLFSYESHFAHYQPGDYYRKHVDAFKGQSNRILSTVLYLNNDWRSEEGGELTIYAEDDSPLTRVSPTLGTLVVFLSEEFPHEVLPAQRDRYSIAGWFRLNQSVAGRIDPQR